jgi:hypothetical protein
MRPIIMLFSAVFAFAIWHALSPVDERAQEPDSRTRQPNAGTESDAEPLFYYGNRSERASSAPAGSAFHFATPLVYQFRWGDGYHDPEALLIADINADGRDDLVASTTYNQLLVWRQQPDGTLASPEAFVFSSINYSTRGQLVIADFNADGIPDMAMSGNRQEVWGNDPDIINLLLSTRGGAPVQRQVRVEKLQHLNDWQAMDVNRDGHWDIVGGISYEYPAGTRCGLDDTIFPTVCPAIGVVYGNGQGDFQRLDPIMIGTPYGIAETETGDVDGDGLTDLLAFARHPYVYGVTRQQDIWWFRQRREGGFEPRVTLYTLSDYSGGGAIAAGNIDGDPNHRVDVVSASKVSTLRVHPQGAPNQPIEPYDPLTPRDRVPHWDNSVLAVDIDGDRQGDVVAAQMQWVEGVFIPQVAVYLQRDGVLQPPFYTDAPAASSGYADRSLAIGDLNGDGCKDLAIDSDSYRLALLYGRNCKQRSQIALQSFGIAGHAPRVHLRQRIRLPVRGTETLPKSNASD